MKMTIQKDNPEDKTKLLDFPTDFTFKIVGLSNDTFENAAIGIIRKHFPKMGEGAVKHKISHGGKYLSLSITVKATAQTQLNAAYHELSQHELIIFVL